VALADRVRPIGANDKLVEVADDQQRRVFQRQRVLLQLAKCCFQIFPLSLVFPSETAALPNVSPAVTTARLRRAALETVEISARVRFSWGWFIQKAAQVDKMLLGGRAFFQLDRPPLSNKLINAVNARQPDDTHTSSSRSSRPTRAAAR
jgi:hypothetical protein